jgi:hypothetical protein
MITAFTLLRFPRTSAVSEEVGIYALVERVLLEPDDKNPQRIQLWGAFATNRSAATPKKGYVYFTLPDSQQAAAQKEWSDFKTMPAPAKL